MTRSNLEGSPSLEEKHPDALPNPLEDRARQLFLAACSGNRAIVNIHTERFSISPNIERGIVTDSRHATRGGKPLTSTTGLPS